MKKSFTSFYFHNSKTVNKSILFIGALIIFLLLIKNCENLAKDEPDGDGIEFKEPIVFPVSDLIDRDSVDTPTTVMGFDKPVAMVIPDPSDPDSPKIIFADGTSEYARLLRFHEVIDILRRKGNDLQPVCGRGSFANPKYTCLCKNGAGKLLVKFNPEIFIPVGTGRVIDVCFGFDKCDSDNSTCN